MLIAIQSLKPGYVLKKDIYVNADKPLLKSGTVLEDTHIDFLKAFLVDRVEIESVRKDGKKVHAKPLEEEKKQSGTLRTSAPETSSLHENYRGTVEAYQNFFEQWQSGAPINIGAFRKAVTPLMTGFLSGPDWFADFLLRRTMIRSLADRHVTLGLLSVFLGKKISLSQGDLYQIGLAGMLADCGMSKFPLSLLNRNGEYVGGERSLYEKHVLDSYKMLKGVPTLKEEAMLAVIQHHEREDGSGYPLHLHADQLSIYGKILAVCDTFLYQAAKSQEAGWPVRFLETMLTQSYGKLSRYLLEQFCNEIMAQFVGMHTSLSNNQTGTIMFIPENEPTRPVVRLENNQVMALSENKRIVIDRILPQQK